MSPADQHVTNADEIERRTAGTWFAHGHSHTHQEPGADVLEHDHRHDHRRGLHDYDHHPLEQT